MSGFRCQPALASSNSYTVKFIHPKIIRGKFLASRSAGSDRISLGRDCYTSRSRLYWPVFENYTSQHAFKELHFRIYFRKNSRREEINTQWKPPANIHQEKTNFVLGSYTFNMLITSEITCSVTNFYFFRKPLLLMYSFPYSIN